MPFTKTKTKEQTLPAALGISEERSDAILNAVHKMVHLVNNNEKNLKALYERYDNMELLFATYAYGRMVESHSDKDDMPDELKEMLEGVLGNFSSIFGKGK